MSCIVNIGFGKELSRYSTGPSNIPGLTVETETFEEFGEVVRAAAPGLLGGATSGPEIDFHHYVVRAA